MRGSLYLFTAIGISLIGCHGSDSDQKQASRQWNCTELAVPNGQTTWCRSGDVASARGTTSAPADPGATVGLRTYGVPSSEEPADEAPRSDEGSAAPAPPPVPSAPPEEYECSAGSADCPPADAPVGDAPSGETPPASGGGNYKCSRDGTSVECTKTDLSCKPGTVPAGDQCVPETTGTTMPPATGTTAPTVTSNCFEVGLVTSAPNADGSTTWTYRVRELECAQDLSNWVLATGSCVITGGTTRYESVSPDPNAQLVGVKWETGGGFSDSQFSITTTGATSGMIKFATKGPKVAYGTVPGPVCP